MFFICLYVGRGRRGYANIIIYEYAFRAVGCFPGPYLSNSFNRRTHNAKHYSSQLFKGGTSSSTGMAAVVIAIAHEKKHTH